MSKRTVRVNELMMQEISDILHTRWRSETINVTITGVSVSPDLRNATVNYSLVGSPAQGEVSRKFLHRHIAEVRHELSKRIVLKYLPKLEFRDDETLSKVAGIQKLIDEIMPEEPKAPEKPVV